MPIFNESPAQNFNGQTPGHQSYVHSLADCFDRNIPVTSVEFNPPPVSSLEKQELGYWQSLCEPDAEDRLTLKRLAGKLQALHRCREIDSFISITDSAAGVLRMHNLTFMRLLADPGFTRRQLAGRPLVWEPRRTILHLTRNHSITWTDHFLDQCRRLEFRNLLLITGDPLNGVTFKPAHADAAALLTDEDRGRHRLKSSVELLKYVAGKQPDFFLGVSHNPFLTKAAAHKHLLEKTHAGAAYIVTQPVSYYDECWRVMPDFADFLGAHGIGIPIILGVFNYFVPCDQLGVEEQAYQKQHKFWKRLFGFVPEGVRSDYDKGLDGIEILARSIQKLTRNGYFHFDVMNAEKSGWTLIKNRKRLAFESDRLMSTFEIPK